MFFLKMEPAISKSEYYTNFTAPRIYIKTTVRPSRQCSATGDPHYTVRNDLSTYNLTCVLTITMIENSDLISNLPCCH